VTEPAPPVEVAVGAIVRRADELLLVKRGRGDAVGKWSVPGGRVRFGETLADAVRREVLEETGLRVRAGAFAGWAERIGGDPSPHHYVILDFFATEDEPGAPVRPGDDAAEVAWVPLARLAQIDLVDGLATFLAAAGVG
jgi:ADP-ribose pyrophosphatase YjhB (NUDIX family)